MASRARVQRAHETETAVAQWFRERGWPYAEPVGAGRPGTDVTGMPGLHVEIRARRQVKLSTWLRGFDGLREVPLLVHRPDGYGTGSMHLWPVTFRLQDATTLLRDAGYGTDEEDQ